MKLEEGMYVRTKWGLAKYIHKLVTRETIRYVIDKKIVYDNVEDWEDVLLSNEILKASHNIIDLIEIGDVVELFMEDDIDKEDTNIFEIIAITTDKKEIGVFGKDLELEFIPIENIRKICTKEQFESMSYKVGD